MSGEHEWRVLQIACALGAAAFTVAMWCVR